MENFKIKMQFLQSNKIQKNNQVEKIQKLKKIYKNNKFKNYCSKI